MIIMAFKLTVVACTEGDNKGAARRFVDEKQVRECWKLNAEIAERGDS